MGRFALEPFVHFKINFCSHSQTISFVDVFFSFKIEHKYVALCNFPARVFCPLNAGIFYIYL